MAYLITWQELPKVTYMTTANRRGPRPRHNDPDPATTGENLRAVRLSRGISQKQLAVALGYATHVGVTHMESGRRGMSEAQLRKAADFLGVAPTVIRAPQVTQ